ncbi:hypothetical protein AB0C18_39765, partial [Nonomuraea muscovyensis]
MAGRLKRAEFRGSACPTTWVTAIRIAVTPSGGYAGGWETTTTWVVFAGSIVEFPTSWMTYVCLPAVGGVSAKLNDPSAAAVILAAHPRQTLIADRQYYGRAFEQELTERDLRLL